LRTRGALESRGLAVQFIEARERPVVLAELCQRQRQIEANARNRLGVLGPLERGDRTLVGAAGAFRLALEQLRKRTEIGENPPLDRVQLKLACLLERRTVVAARFRNVAVLRVDRRAREKPIEHRPLVRQRPRILDHARRRGNGVLLQIRMLARDTQTVRIDLERLLQPPDHARQPRRIAHGIDRPLPVLAHPERNGARPRHAGSRDRPLARLAGLAQDLQRLVRPAFVQEQFRLTPQGALPIVGHHSGAMPLQQALQTRRLGRRPAQRDELLGRLELIALQQRVEHESIGNLLRGLRRQEHQRAGILGIERAAEAARLRDVQRIVGQSGRRSKQESKDEYPHYRLRSPRPIPARLPPPQPAGTGNGRTTDPVRA